MIIFTILLNQLCMGGLTILSWFIVFIPFIMMTYVTTILLYVFGLNPSKGKYQPQPDPRSTHVKKSVPQPYNREKLTCTETEFGCCPDGTSIRNNTTGSNCPPHIKPIKPHSGFGKYFYWQFSKPTSTPMPSAAPSATPSAAPTAAPSAVPSSTPSAVPSATPSAVVNATTRGFR